MTQPSDPSIDWTETFPHLPRAPIVEAVIHWTARATADLEPEALKTSLRAMVPHYPNVADIRRLEFHAKLSEGKVTHAHGDDWEGLRLTSKDGRYVAQLMRNGVALSRLEPYQDWDRFSAEALKIWGTYTDLAAPSMVTRLGVRFINRLNLSQTSGLGSVLKSPPRRLESLGLPISDFLYQSTHEVPGEPYQVKVIDTIQATESGSALIIDIDASTTRECDVGDTAVLMGHLERLHCLKNKAFFNLVTEEAILSFREEPA
jgi:uncharacterized protein (TIGR04255 family)